MLDCFPAGVRAPFECRSWPLLKTEPLSCSGVPLGRFPFQIWTDGSMERIQTQCKAAKEIEVVTLTAPDSKKSRVKFSLAFLPQPRQGTRL